MIYPGIAIKKNILGQNIVPVCFLCYYLSELQSAAKKLADLEILGQY